MEGRAAQLQRQQQELAEQRRAGGSGGLPTRQQDLLVLQVRVAFWCCIVGDLHCEGQGSWQMMRMMTSIARILQSVFWHVHAVPSLRSICPAPFLQVQVSEVCHASLVDCRPGGRERWQPRVAHIRCEALIGCPAAPVMAGACVSSKTASRTCSSMIAQPHGCWDASCIF